MTKRDSVPFMRLRDLPLAILFLPFALLFGIHVAGLAMLIRKWTRIPYLITMIILYTMLLIPLWMPGSKVPFWPSLLGTIATIVCLVLPIGIRGRDEIMDGNNFEASAPAHIVLVILYLLIPAIHAAVEARARSSMGTPNPRVTIASTGERDLSDLAVRILLARSR